MKTPYIASIELTNDTTRLYPFHLGTDERIARECVVDIFKGRKYDAPIRTVALMDADQKIVDVYDGEWASEEVDDNPFHVWPDEL